jgi:glycosyltransferase involved in cell wall biosynthesis
MPVSDFAVVTTFNEAETIGPLVRTLRRLGFAVIVVDDLSTDSTVATAMEAGAKVYMTMGRKGIGPCLMRGWRYALEEGATRIVQLDAGGSHDPLEARRMVDALVTTGADMIIGSRFMHGSGYDNSHGRRLRPAMSQAAATACNLATGARFTDWTSGFRAFTASAAKELLRPWYMSRMHGWQIEVLAQANAYGLRIYEWPIHYVAGRSSFGWKVAHEASNAWLHVFFHVGGSNGNKRLSGQQGGAL